MTSNGLMTGFSNRNRSRHARGSTRRITDALSAATAVTSGNAGRLRLTLVLV